MNQEPPAAFGDYLADVGRTAKAEILDSESTLDARETLRQTFVDTYNKNVYQPRLEFWNTFNEFIKSKLPTQINPSILKPTDDDDYYGYSRLYVASWRFKHVSADSQLETDMVVEGRQILTEGRGNLYKEKPRFGRKSYVADRIRQINAYVVHTTTHNLQARDDSQDFFFRGQEFDNLKTKRQLEEAGHKPAEYGGGVISKTRHNQFNGYFSAPIVLPHELKEGSFLASNKDDDLSLEAIHANYHYLTHQTACDSYGAIDPTSPRSLFSYDGNEALAYMQAEALYNFMREECILASEE